MYKFKAITFSIIIAMSSATIASEVTSLPLKHSLSLKQNPLPNPLGLQQALAYADEMHPDIALAQAELDDAQGNLLYAQSRTAIRSYLDITAVTKKLTTTGEFTNDSRALLTVSKSIYDFGRSRALEKSRSALISSREYSLFDVRLRHRYEIMKLFFDVLLADKLYRVENEKMTIKFLNFDKKRERHSLGMVSDVELLELENDYLKALDLRTASDKKRRSTRLFLAIALNHPDDLPADLLEPVLTGLDREIPERDEVYNAALAMNQTILAIKQEIESARLQLQAERARYYPSISAEFELGEYARKFATRGDVAASVNFHIPIYQGNENKAAIARAAAALASQAALLRRAEYTLLRNIQGLIEQLEILYIKRNTASQGVQYRDLDLDKRRALYEMEAQTNMGDALASMTEALWLSEKIDYEITLTWAQLDILRAKPFFDDEQSHEVIRP